MNLGEVRAQFVKVSGRYDLINEDDTDNGANFFINSGQRFLDRKVDHKKVRGSYFASLAADGYYLALPYIRVIEEVWVNDTSERWGLTRHSLSDMKDNYPDLISGTDSGDSMYWCPVVYRGIQVTDMNSLGTFANFVAAESGGEDTSGILIMPPTDVALVVEVIGKFWSPTLSSDSDESYWTARHFDILLWASLRQLEVSYRNREGAADWDAALSDALFDLDKDEVSEQVHNTDQLEG